MSTSSTRVEESIRLVELDIRAAPRQPAVAERIAPAKKAPMVRTPSVLVVWSSTVKRMRSTMPRKSTKTASQRYSSDRKALAPALTWKTRVEA